VEWILKLAAAGDEGRCVDIMEISKPDDLGDIANLGLTLTEAKQLLARVQREISTAQAREQAVRRPVCPCRNGICQVKDLAGCEFQAPQKRLRLSHLQNPTDDVIFLANF
jgi:hypothetical protein